MIWWKVYFWTVLALTLIGVPLVYGNLSPWTFADFLEVILSVFFLVGLYSYIFQKPMFTKDIWRIIFWISAMVSIVLEVLYKFTTFDFLSSMLESRTITSGQDLLIGIIITLPVYYVLYQLGYGKTTSKKK